MRTVNDVIDRRFESKHIVWLVRHTDGKVQDIDGQHGSGSEKRKKKKSCSYVSAQEPAQPMFAGE